jgi:hypothetical protein
MSSCDAVNQALLWLSSGNSRDSGDLYHLPWPMTYFTTNGTNWDISHLWLSDESMFWFNIQCVREISESTVWRSMP